uniref:Uncharacterized protein n=1 Tax=Anguilla anguilla TaxID=7936 RepID=A0A0E9QC60_ANGAN
MLKHPPVVHRNILSCSEKNNAGCINYSGTLNTNCMPK